MMISPIPFLSKCRFIVRVCSLVLMAPVLVQADYLSLDIETRQGQGTVLIQLLPHLAPKHVERIKQLTAEGAYDQIAFHRAIGGFMIQTGDVRYGRRDNYDHTKVGTGSSPYPDLYAEISEVAFASGVVGMARGRYINSANSQFFIMTDRHPSLDGKYTVIGAVKKGMDVVRQIALGSPARQGKVDAPDFIIKATIVDE
ncbi:MAG: peptidylprolyl isomerase [Cellvibrionaceae bacterium]|nr:peptidylprolyl isomerase [Cellvibrionaceae bacterium]